MVMAFAPLKNPTTTLYDEPTGYDLAQWGRGACLP
jgi:hypothetical protein